MIMLVPQKCKIIFALSNFPFSNIAIALFNPNCARWGRGGIIDPPLVFFYSHFSCVRARDLKFYDVKTKLDKYCFC